MTGTVESTFYEVPSDDLAVLAEVSAAFHDVEEAVKHILSEDGLVRVSICRRSDGLFYSSTTARTGSPCGMTLLRRGTRTIPHPVSTPAGMRRRPTR